MLPVSMCLFSVVYLQCFLVIKMHSVSPRKLNLGLIKDLGALASCLGLKLYARRFQIFSLQIYLNSSVQVQNKINTFLVFFFSRASSKSSYHREEPLD